MLAFSLLYALWHLAAWVFDFGGDYRRVWPFVALASIYPFLIVLFDIVYLGKCSPLRVWNIRRAEQLDAFVALNWLPDVCRRIIIVVIGVVTLLGGSLLIRFTGTKLIAMAKVRGFMSGAEAIQWKVASKGLAKTFTRLGTQDVYWISWGPTQHPSARIDVPKDVWDSTGIGDELELVYLPESNAGPFHRAGEFAKDGHFLLDLGLLGLELGICWLGFTIIRGARRPLPRPEFHYENVI